MRQYPDVYESKSHFVRISVIREIKRMRERLKKDKNKDLSKKRGKNYGFK